MIIWSPTCSRFILPPSPPNLILFNCKSIKLYNCIRRLWQWIRRNCVCVCVRARERERENSAWMIKIVHSNTVPRLSFQLSPYTPVKAIEMKMFIKYWCSEHKISIFSQTLNYAVRKFDIPTAKMSCHNRERKIDGKRKRIYQYAVR